MSGMPGMFWGGRHDLHSAQKVYTGQKNKTKFLKSLFIDKGICADETGYIGDDLNDLASMKLVGFSACPADACDEVKRCVHYISPLNGGCGAVREIMEYVLKQSGEWERIIQKIC